MGGKIRASLVAVIKGCQYHHPIMVLTNIYRVMTMCMDGVDYLEGCNILLQI